MNPVDLQEIVDRELKQLPMLHAPRTLLPRVLASTVEREPSRSYAWVWQLAGLAAVAAAIVLAVMYAPAAPRVAAGARRVEEAATLVRVFWQVLLAPVAVYLFALAVSLALACAVIWTALEHFALGGASQQ